MSVPSGIPLDGSNNDADFFLDDVNTFVDHAASLREKQESHSKLYGFNTTALWSKKDEHGTGQ